jgi:hypothetical protein
VIGDLALWCFGLACWAVVTAAVHAVAWGVVFVLDRVTDEGD